MSQAGESDRVAYGRAVRVNGQVTAAPGSGVRLEHAPAGEGWRPVATTTSDADGSYSFAVRAERSGAYRAVTGAGASAPRRVTVVARIAGRATRHVHQGSSARVRGVLRPRKAGRTVQLQLRSGKRWRTVDRDRTGAGGRYATAWRPGATGAYRLRVRFAGDRLNGEASRKLRKVNVYRPSAASWYGPGFYGSRTACGQTISSSILGVANKSLPCGTRVTLRYHGRSVTVPVIDRGPYAAGREWDLTPATKNRLGFGSTGTVWVTR
jgi:rare lipoprotein A